MTDVADQILSRLREWDVSQVFAYPGDGINGLVAAFGRADNNPCFVQTRHEEMAAFAATGYAKFSGSVGVCMATSGPGAIHLLNGLYDAKLDHVPVVAIVGQTARSAMGGSYRQEWTCKRYSRGGRRLCVGGGVAEHSRRADLAIAHGIDGANCPRRALRPAGAALLRALAMRSTGAVQPPNAAHPVLLATAPKSNAAYLAFGEARQMARETGSLMPPMHILNAPTRLMRDLGYGKGYVYDHATEEGFSGQNYFPDGDRSRQFLSSRANAALSAKSKSGSNIGISFVNAPRDRRNDGIGRNRDGRHQDGSLRLDRWFKRHYPGLGHGQLEKLLRTGRIRVNGKRAKSGDRVEPGQAIQIPPLGELASPVRKCAVPAAACGRSDAAGCDPPPRRGGDRSQQAAGARRPGRHRNRAASRRAVGRACGSAMTNARGSCTGSTRKRAVFWSLPGPRRRRRFLTRAFREKTTERPIGLSLSGCRSRSRAGSPGPPQDTRAAEASASGRMPRKAGTPSPITA